MDDPGVIANRLAQATKEIVDQARDALSEGWGKTQDVESYTAGDLIATLTKSADVAFTGGVRLALDAVGEDQKPPFRGRRVVVDAMEAITRRMIRETGKVVQDVSEALDAKSYTPSNWATTLIKLADIALLGGIELAETALIGPAPFETEPKQSAVYPAAGNGKRRLALQSGGLARPGTADPIPDSQLTFWVPSAGGPAEAPGNVLQSAQNQFQIVVDPSGLISGLYLGQVEVVQLNADDTDGAVLGTVPVDIEL